MSSKTRKLNSLIRSFINDESSVASDFQATSAPLMDTTDKKRAYGGGAVGPIFSTDPLPNYLDYVPHYDLVHEKVDDAMSVAGLTTTVTVLSTKFREEKENYIKEIAKYTADASKLSEEVRVNKDAYMASQIDQKNLQTRTFQLERDLAKISTDLKTQEGLKNLAEIKVAKTESELKKTEEEKKQLETEKADLEKKISASTSTADIAKLEAELQAVKQDLANKDATLNTIITTKDAAVAAQKVEEDKGKKLAQDLLALETEKATYESKAKTLEAELKKADEELKKSQTEEFNLKGNLLNLNKTLSELQVNSSATISELTRQLKEAQDQLAAVPSTPSRTLFRASTPPPTPLTTTTSVGPAPLSTSKSSAPPPPAPLPAPLTKVSIPAPAPAPSTTTTTASAPPPPAPVTTTTTAKSSAPPPLPATPNPGKEALPDPTSPTSTTSSTASTPLTPVHPDVKKLDQQKEVNYTLYTTSYYKEDAEYLKARPIDEEDKWMLERRLYNGDYLDTVLNAYPGPIPEKSKMLLLIKPDKRAAFETYYTDLDKVKGGALDKKDARERIAAIYRLTSDEKTTTPNISGYFKSFADYWFQPPPSKPSTPKKKP
jgi:predicted  nucleic acid-binding Zn-ribbon protein